MRLTSISVASKVTLVHCRDSLRAEKTLQDRLFKKIDEGNIAVIWNRQLAEVKGDGQVVTGVKLTSTVDGSVTEIAADGCGHHPNTGTFAGQLTMKEGYLEVRSGIDGTATTTSVAGIFTMGDVADSVYRQAITSAENGCMAALDAERYLASI